MLYKHFHNECMLALALVSASRSSVEHDVGYKTMIIRGGFIAHQARNETRLLRCVVVVA